MLTKEECEMYLEDLVKDSCIPVGHMMIKRHHIAESGLRQLINEHFELLEKHKALQDENGRLNFNNIANNINDMNYKLWLENPPLKFEEMKEQMWVWDNKIKQYYQISCVFKDNREMVTYGLMNGFVLFEENRFYRKQVTDD